MKNLLMLCVLFLFVSAGCKKEEPEDPCVGVTCYNNGSCVDGKCQCIGYWTGEDCREQKNPAGILGATVTVTKMPATDANGAGWDLTSGPDLYIIVKRNGQEIMNTSTQFAQNSGVGTNWWKSMSFSPTDQISVQLYDYDDFDADDYMGGVQGQIYYSTNGFPSVVTLDCGTCPVAIAFSDLTYL